MVSNVMSQQFSSSHRFIISEQVHLISSISFPILKAIMKGGNGDIKRTQTYDKLKEEPAELVVEVIEGPVGKSGEKVEQIVPKKASDKVTA